MSNRAHQLVDHRGTRRVTNYLAAAEIKLRDATQKDARLLWLWANDSGVRASAFSQDPIGWEPHVAWLDCKLREKNCAIYIAYRSSEEPIGQARFDWDKTGVAGVDLSVDQAQRKTGVGSALLRRAVDELFATKPVHSVHALIKPENRASIGAFENADFRINGSTNFQGHPAVQMVSTSLT
jgi:RimJ/RimL family protein N-acetyltransferase